MDYDIHPDQIISPQRPSIISIEGIPGSGKSAVMDLLEERFKDKSDVIILREPTSIWEEIKDEDANLIDLYFKDQNRYGFIFQLVYFMAVERQLQRAIHTHQDKRVIVCERSLLSARTVYHEMIPTSNRIKYEVYQKLFQKEGLGNVYPDHIILLDTEPRECVGKTSRIDWRGEEVITLEYLQRCRRHHMEMKQRHSGGWTSISGKPDHIINEAGLITEIVVDTLQTVATDDRYQIPGETMVVSLEGNIGAGKSTLLTELERRCKEREIEEIRILREPVDEWERVTDGSRTILELFYENPAEYGFPLQILVGLTTLYRMHRELLDHPDTKIILSERSILSSRKVFAEMLHQQGFMDNIEEKVYQMLFNGIEHRALINPVMMMYIDTDPTTCLHRIKLRNRRGENGITLDELQKCESYHKTMFRQTNVHIRSIDTDLEIDGVKINWTDTMIGWCKQLKGGEIPCRLTSPVKENLGERDWWEDCTGEDINWDHSPMGSNTHVNIEELIEPVRGLCNVHENREEVYLIKLKYGTLFYRFALPDWRLTNQRLKQEIVTAWPELEEKDLNLEWKRVERDNDGTCDDKHLNESLNYIELMDGNTVDHILEYDIQLPHHLIRDLPSSKEIICGETGEKQL